MLTKWLIKWLLTPRWRTTDLKNAELSPCQYKPADDGNGYKLSILGIINALATWVMVCLVVNTDSGKLNFKKPWW